MNRKYIGLASVFLVLLGIGILAFPQQKALAWSASFDLAYDCKGWWVYREDVYSPNTATVVYSPAKKADWKAGQLDQTVAQDVTWSNSTETSHTTRYIKRMTDCQITTPPPPSTTAPSTTAPSTTAPSTTAPSTTAPSTTAPSTTAPSTTAPVTTTVPATTLPPTTVPSTPKPTTPVSTSPATTTPATNTPNVCVEKNIDFDKVPQDKEYNGSSDSLTLKSGGPVKFIIRFFNYVNNSQIGDDQKGNLEDNGVLTINYPSPDLWLLNSDGSKEIFIQVILIGECQNKVLGWTLIISPTPTVQPTCVPYAQVEAFIKDQEHELWIRVTGGMTVVDIHLKSRSNPSVDKEIIHDTFSTGEYKVGKWTGDEIYEIRYIADCGNIKLVQNPPLPTAQPTVSNIPQPVSTPVSVSTSSIPQGMPSTGYGDIVTETKRSGEQIPIMMLVGLVIISLIAIGIGAFLVKKRR